MSRSHPNKRKPRHARATAQIVVEGYTEEAFCRHLKCVFARDCGISVEIHNARGGSPKDVIQAALRRKGFDRTFIMYDTDLHLPESWSAKSRAAGHIVVASTPCVEALFLSILGANVPASTEGCKKAFSTHLDDKKKCDYRNYPAIFPKGLLESCSHPAVTTLRSVFKKDE